MEWLLVVFSFACLALSAWLAYERRRNRDAQAQYQLLFEQNPLPFWVFHRDTLRILEANRAAIEQYGYSREEFRRMSIADIRPPEDVVEAIQVARSAHPEERRGRVWRHVRRDGTIMPVSVHSADIVFRGQPARLVLAIDISERARDQELLEASEQRFQLVARATSDAVFDWNIVTGESWRTDSFDALFGYRSAEMPPTIEGWRDRVHPDDLARVDARLSAFFASDELEWQDSYRFRRGDGGWAHVMDRGRLVRDADGQPLRMVGGMVDITRQHEIEEALREQESRLAWQANHDELTGLLNRSALLAALEHLIGGRKCTVSLLYFEIDELILINDSLGHEVGDEVLRQVAAPLRASVSEADCVGRVAGSEFLAVLRENGDSIEVQATRILEALALPVEALGTLHYLGINAGLARCPDHGDTPERLFRNAGLATHEARRRGQHQLVTYTPEFDRSASERLMLVSRLHEALEKHEFELFFQPVYDVRTRVPRGMEALVRWRHPERGLVPPIEFIPVCEDSGLIVPLGRWVLREAARHRAQLVAAGWAQLSIAVNVSALQFRSGELLQDLPALMQEFSLPRGFLELELTESLVMHDPEAVIQTMRALRALGAQLAIDDFGTGYSSMSYLRRLPVDKLKIDRSFVTNVESDPHNAAICESILALAKSFGLRVIAEGVETQAQLDWLREHGCEKAQGYLLSKPLPFADVLAKLGAGGGPVECVDGRIAPAR